MDDNLMVVALAALFAASTIALCAMLFAAAMP